jgi:thioredoxin-like negative regulator of GroEL
MVAPIMDELAVKYKGKIKIYKVNTDKEQELARAFNISSIPAILYVPMTGQPQMNVGAMSKADYEKVINDFLLTSTIQ